MEGVVLLCMLCIACLCILGAFVDNKEEEDNDSDN